MPAPVGLAASRSMAPNEAQETFQKHEAPIIFFFLYLFLFFFFLFFFFFLSGDHGFPST